MKKGSQILTFIIDDDMLFYITKKSDVKIHAMGCNARYPTNKKLCRKFQEIREFARNSYLLIWMKLSNKMSEKLLKSVSFNHSSVIPLRGDITCVGS